MIRIPDGRYSGFDWFVAILGVVFALVALSAAAEGNPAQQKRSSVTSEYSLVEGETSVTTSNDEYRALESVGKRTKTPRASRQSKLSLRSAEKPNTDFWFYGVDLELFQDQDRDGYFYGIDLLFDADTYFEVAEVYAVLYLSYEGGPWNEYAATENFLIFGASPDDDYVVITELESGYPTGNYDLLIELFDAYDDSFLAYAGPEDLTQLALLPLEDAARDRPSTGRVVVVSEGGGGSFDGLVLLLLVAMLIVRRARTVERSS